MRQIAFLVRLDDQTAKALSKLARTTERSRAGVIRWLIHKTINELNAEKPRKTGARKTE
jgi:predicted transcriptional regulator